MDVTLLRNGGTSQVDIDPSFLGDRAKHRSLREAVLMYAANLRQGTSKVKHRGEIALSTRQLFRQKGTGRARVRHRQVVSCRGGGRAHGPAPRDWGYQIPRKARRAALRNALFTKFRDGEVLLCEDFRLEAPKTSVVAGVLRTLGVEGTCLIVPAAHDPVLVRSARNIPRARVSPVDGLNALDVLNCSKLLLTEGALEKLREKHGRA